MDWSRLDTKQGSGLFNFFHEKSSVLLFSNTEFSYFLVQLISKQRIDHKSDIFYAKAMMNREYSWTVRLRAEIVLSSPFLFSVFRVVNYTDNYFGDLALHLFEQKPKIALHGFRAGA